MAGSQTMELGSIEMGLHSSALSHQVATRASTLGIWAGRLSMEAASGHDPSWKGTWVLSGSHSKCYVTWAWCRDQGIGRQGFWVQVEHAGPEHPVDGNSQLGQRAAQGVQLDTDTPDGQSEQGGLCVMAPILPASLHGLPLQHRLTFKALHTPCRLSYAPEMMRQRHQPPFPMCCMLQASQVLWEDMISFIRPTK